MRTRFDFPSRSCYNITMVAGGMTMLGASVLISSSARGKDTVAACWLSRRLFKPRSPARWRLNSYYLSVIVTRELKN
jgi:hypothetical protein